MVQAEASGKTCFGIGEAQPIDAERADWGEYEILFEIQPNKYNLSHCHTPPLSPSILEGELTHSCLTILIVTIETSNF